MPKRTSTTGSELFIVDNSDAFATDGHLTGGPL